MADINTEFGSEVRFKDDYNVGEFITVTPEDVLQVANYWHKRYIQLHHVQLAELIKIKYEDIGRLLETVNNSENST